MYSNRYFHCDSLFMKRSENSLPIRVHFPSIYKNYINKMNVILTSPIFLHFGSNLARF